MYKYKLQFRVCNFLYTWYLLQVNLIYKNISVSCSRILHTLYVMLFLQIVSHGFTEMRYLIQEQQFKVVAYPV